MIPVGYTAKKVVSRPDWLEVPLVQDIYSVSNCVSKNFLDYIPFWRHNGYWLFDNPDIIRDLARENNVSLEEHIFFYYEAYEKEFDEERMQWQSFEPEDFPTNIIPTTKRELQGFDVVSFSLGTNPQCSPLSCNYLAREMRTNSHCLLESFEEAKQYLETGKFENCEPGPYRIFAVYTIQADN